MTVNVLDTQHKANEQGRAHDSTISHSLWTKPHSEWRDPFKNVDISEKASTLIRNYKPEKRDDDDRGARFNTKVSPETLLKSAKK